MNQKCPFVVGQRVKFINRSQKAGPPGVLGLPSINEVVTITAVNEGPFGYYVRWDTMNGYPLGGLHWSEFAPS